MRKNSIGNIQVLRGLAASAVVLLHSKGSAEDYGYEATLSSSLGGWGASGVDIFFVLSGFIMIYSYMGKRAPLSFLKGRVIRIVPSYWAFSLLLVAILVAVPGIFNKLEFDASQALTSFLFLSRAVGFDNPYIYVGWTLEYEFLFYGIFALSLLLPIWWMSVGFISLVIISLPMLTGVSPVLYEFLFGVLLGLLMRNWTPGKPLAAMSLAIGTALWIATILLPDPSDMERVWIWGLPSTLIVLGAYGCWQCDNRAMIFLGDASYSIYLIQVFSIPAFYKACSVINLPTLPGDLFVVICVLITLAVGCLWHVAFDIPVRRFLGGRPQRETMVGV